jgi:hypothetical protein
VAAFVTREAETAAELTRSAATLGTVQTNFPHHDNDIQALDTGTPRPQAPHPAAPDPGLPQPPGGWSEDPVMDVAQRIAYGHAWRDHAEQFPGMTQDQLADLVHRMLTGNPNTGPDLFVGQMPSGSTAIYKDGILVVDDPRNTDDLGTVFKPDHGFQDFLKYVAPLIRQPPNLPPMLDHPPVAPPQLQPDPAPLPRPPTQLVDPVRLPPCFKISPHQVLTSPLVNLRHFLVGTFHPTHCPRRVRHRRAQASTGPICQRTPRR